jgi:hypothetical protein
LCSPFIVVSGMLRSADSASRWPYYGAKRLVREAGHDGKPSGHSEHLDSSVQAVKNPVHDGRPSLPPGNTRFYGR